MSFPTTSVLDSGTGSDGVFNSTAPNGNWGGYVNDNVESGGMQRLSNVFQTVSTTQVNGSWWIPSTFGPDSEVFLDIGTKGNNYVVHLYARVQTPHTNGMDGYWMRLLVSASNLQFYRIIDRVQTQLGSDQTSMTFNNGDSIGFEVTGTGATVTLQAYRKPSGGSWSTFGTAVTDTNANRIVSAGYIGFGSRDDTTVTFSATNFGGGTVAESGIAPTVNDTATVTEDIAMHMPIYVPMMKLP